MTFRHEALLYDGRDGFAAGTLQFLREGLDAGEPTMVAVGAERMTILRDALGADADRVRFVDMAELGRNPGRIIPAWRDFLATHAGEGPVRGIGEPVWAGRSADELVECQLHESLLNLAFADADDFRLVCPYDREALDEAVLHEACRSHPAVVDSGGRQVRSVYRGEDLLAPFDAPLPPPAAHAEILAYDRSSLSDVRDAVGARAAAAGLPDVRTEDLVLAVHEMAGNSIRHGGGHGVLRIWETDHTLVCELRDRGRVRDPLVGRDRPSAERLGGRGLYIAHQVCDLVQLRSDERGTVVRLHMQRG